MYPLMSDNTTTVVETTPDAVQQLPDSKVVRDLLALGAIKVEEVAAADAPDAYLAVVPDGYRLELVKHDLERVAPRRTTGHVTLTDPTSWRTYFAKHGNDLSEVYGDVTGSRITAILNAPGAQRTAFGDHRATLQLQHSESWKAWTRIHNELLSQTDFAEHIEARSPDLVIPDAGTMLELAQSIKATTGVKFECGSRLHDGQRTFTYAETIEGRAGQRGELEIPTSLAIRLQVWRGVDIATPVTARFRYRIGAQGLQLGVVLDRIEDVLDAAWDALLGDLAEHLPVPVLAGRPPEYGR